MALMLGGMAVGIIGFSTKSGLSPLPGLVLLPVAICFVVHALGQYYARARAIRRREPGPYEDKNGPVALAIVLSLAALDKYSFVRDAYRQRRQYLIQGGRGKLPDYEDTDAPAENAAPAPGGTEDKTPDGEAKKP